MSSDSPSDLRRRLARLLAEYRRQWGDAAAQMLRADLTSILLDDTEEVEAPAKAKEEEDGAESSAPSICGKFPDIVGQSAPMLEVFELILKVAPTDATVLIQGESGTGKELVARAIHDHSRRKRGAYVAENCAALPETLLESELFGHTRGAFTGADRNRKGRFAAADKGTLFLDEVGDMSPALQKKLLRALQEGEIRPVGASKTIHVDVRFLSASNKDLAQLVSENRFREDLYYRLSPVRLKLPPLRERGDDVGILVDHFAEHIATQLGVPAPGFTKEAKEALCKYSWPGNVRELQNELQRALALADPGREVDLPGLSQEVQG